MSHYSRYGSSSYSRFTKRIERIFTDAGAWPVSPPILQPAADLLPHYGEALRARACVVLDAHGAELFLVPDYTVPVCRQHVDGGGGNGRYMYSGPVFRPYDPGISESPAEEWQVGMELYSEGDPSIAADVEVLNLALQAMHKTRTRPNALRVGDVSLGKEILSAVPMPEHQRERLRRRWAQPARFTALLARFAGTAPRPQSLDRDALLNDFAAGTNEPTATVRQLLADRNIPTVGRRKVEEIAERLTELVTERDTEPLPTQYADQLQAIMQISGPYQEALVQLAKHASAMTVDLTTAIDRLTERYDAYVASGIDPALLHLDMQLGGELGYYDGMVFEVHAGKKRQLVVASGGRYDRLPQALGTKLCAVGVAIWTQRLDRLRDP